MTLACYFDWEAYSQYIAWLRPERPPTANQLSEPGCLLLLEPVTAELSTCQQLRTAPAPRSSPLRLVMMGRLRCQDVSWICVCGAYLFSFTAGFNILYLSFMALGVTFPLAKRVLGLVPRPEAFLGEECMFSSCLLLQRPATVQTRLTGDLTFPAGVNVTVYKYVCSVQEE